MKSLLTIILILLIVVVNAKYSIGKVNVDNAYKREYIFLNSQLKELKKQYKIVEKQYEVVEKKAKKNINSQQNKLIALNSENERLTEKLDKLERNLEVFDEEASILESTLKQAAFSLNLKKEQFKGVQDIFEVGLSKLESANSITKEKGSFYLESGKQVEGEILGLANLAKIAYYQNEYHMLAPAGKGQLKSWKTIDSGKHLFERKFNQLESLFIYDNLDKPIEKRKAQSILQFIQAGGTIAWVIVFMGIFAFILCIIRAFNLKKYASETLSIESFVELENVEKTLQQLESHKFKFGTKQLLMSLFDKKMSDVDSSNANMDGIIEEGLIHEHKFIDRFGAMILVFAAIAPLMGLLGTVTGMISTFDIITEHGTGDPKLLSQGISEALITTELGLIVAIPTLLFGNMLTGWGKNLKMTLEKLVLRVVNGL